MGSKNPLIYWDTCIILAWIKNEQRAIDEMEGLKEIATKVLNNEVRMITSALYQSEVLKSSLDTAARKKLEGVLKRRNVAVIATDQRVWNLASEIRDYYYSRRKIDGLPTVSTPDAVHLATAILYDADVFYTTDQIDKKGKRRALVPLSGLIANKYNLVIQKPSSNQGNLFAGETLSGQTRKQ